MDPTDHEAAAAGDGRTSEPATPDSSEPAAPEDVDGSRTVTVGTGTVVGVGCIVGTILLTCLGIAFILVLRLF